MNSDNTNINPISIDDVSAPTDERPHTVSNDGPRALAEERLAHLAMLQTRIQRRGGPGPGLGGPGGPGHGPGLWREGRGGQGRVLALLAMNPEISQRELTYLLGFSRQALAELLAKLEHKGFIERTQSDADRRTVLVTLTDSGREAAEEIDQRMQEPSHLLDGFSDDEAANLADYLGRIIDPLEARIDELREARRRRHADGDHPRGGGRGPHGPHHGPDGERYYRHHGRGHRCNG